MATEADVWSNSSDSESDEEEVAKTVVLKAIQNVKEEQMVKTSCRGKVVVDLLNVIKYPCRYQTYICNSRSELRFISVSLRSTGARNRVQPAGV